MITVDDFVLYCHRTLDGMQRAIDRLDDETVTARPGLPGANTPFGLVTHALGACEWWTAHIVCGHPSARDRDAEFDTTGTVADLREAIEIAKERLVDLSPEMTAATELAHEAHTQTPLGAPWTVGAALIHAYEELAQHLGHLEITVDLLAAGRD